MATNNERRATIIGISGCSSSGKTTLSRLLRDIFPHTYILHQDDFYKPEQDLPLTPTGNLDWDCAAALDLPALVSALDHIHAHGALPPTLVSKEDQNPTHDAHVPAATIAQLRKDVANWLASPRPFPPSLPSVQPNSHSSPTPDPHNPHPSPTSTSTTPPNPPISATHPLILLDGFLLYPPTVAAVRARLDVRLFLTARYEDVVRRRKSRGGYVTLEGWWEDPEGYVEEVVWGNYVRDHGFMFVGGDVQGSVDEGVVRGLGVRVCPGEVGMEGVVRWAVGKVMEGLKEGSDGGG